MSRARPSRQVTESPSLVKRVKDWAVPVTLALVVLSLLLWGRVQLQNPEVMSVRRVQVDGEMHYLQRTNLEQVVAQAVNGNFFTLDLLHMRKRIERLPWVASVSVRRVWPDTLRVRVTERVPLAYWGKDAMVSRQGVVFRPQQLPRLDGLATLEGEAQHAKAITQDYQRMDTLLQTVGMHVSRLRVDARQAWRIETDNGLKVQLGRRDVLPRLTRFVQLYPSLMSQETERRPDTVDLRYSNGFAVHWEALPASDEQDQAGLYREYGEVSRTLKYWNQTRTTSERRG
ncbi:MAG: cell division protein FtsQ/DivIB [Candidatus Thiodiazotropha sp.]